MRPLALGYLRTRVGRALLRRFVGAALLPVVAVAAAGLLEVRRTLLDEADARVARLSKSVGVTLLGALASAAHDTTSGRGAPPDARVAVDADAEAHLRTGRPLLVVHPGAGDARVEVRHRGRDGTVRAFPLDAARTWAAVDEVVAGERASYCVFAGQRELRVRCSADASPALVAAMRAAAEDDRGPGRVVRGETHVLGRRQLFLRFEYGTADWRVVTAESRADVLAPLTRVTALLVALVGLGAALAFAFGHAQIRRSTGPLEQLQAATARVTAGELHAQVAIDSADEYGTLGRAFNTMTATVARQVALLRGLDLIDDAALDERRADGVVEAALAHLVGQGLAARAAIALVDAVHAERGTIVAMDQAQPRARRAALPFSAVVRERLREAPRQLVLTAAEARPRWPVLVAHVAPEGEGRVAVFPLVHDGVPLGAMALAGGAADDPAVAHALDDARRIADRVALGAANAMLLARLDALSLGAIRAFANAIDAASPWTAGHSERVTATAVALGRELGCDADALDRLQRGGLLHDVGKIGVPAEVLNKAGALTDEERRVMQRHPVIGEQILRPLPVFADVLPIVRSHHERIDGTGYPDGLAGDAIPWLARIVAVADVFDALTSSRPYRAGMSHDEAMAIVRRDAGRALDARVVEALEALRVRGALAAGGQAAPVAEPRLAGAA